MTAWAQASRPQPASAFIHLVAPDVALIAHWDELGLAWERWHKGRTLHQLHRLTVSPDTPAGT
jgi:hypothetical protein